MEKVLAGYIAPHLSEIKSLDQLENEPFKGTITEKGDWIYAAIVSESDSLIGPVFHLPFREEFTFNTKSEYFVDGVLVPVPEEWNRSSSGEVTLRDLPEEFAFGIRPTYSPLQSSLTVDDLTLEYRCQSEESSFFVFREKGADWIGVAPLSSQNPWKPNLTVSSIEARLLGK